MTVQHTLEQLLSAARVVQRQLIDGLPPGEEQGARVGVMREVLEAAPIEEAREALANADPASIEDQTLAATRDLVVVLEPSRSMVRAGGEPQRVVDQLWSLGTAWDPGLPLQRAQQVLALAEAH